MEQEEGSSKGHQFSSLSRSIVQAAYAVHLELGTGFLEYIYQKALALELKLAGISCQREVEIPIYYRGELIDTRRVDFLVSDILVETKAVEHIVTEHVAQLAMYLKATRIKVGLLIDFGSTKLEIKRVVQ